MKSPNSEKCIFTIFDKVFFLDRKVLMKGCKFDVLNRNMEIVNGVSATYMTNGTATTRSFVEVKGDIKMDNPYVLKTNHTSKKVYLSDKKYETYHWNRTKKIKIINGKEKEDKRIEINITKEFLDFEFIEGIDTLRCYVNGKSPCFCKQFKDDWKLLNYSIGDRNETLILNLKSDFDYEKEYRFSMDLISNKLYSELKLSFDVTTIWNQTEISIVAGKIGKDNEILVDNVPPICNKNTTLINGHKFDSVKEALDIKDVDVNKTENTFTFHLGPSFSYMKAYQLKCSKNLEGEFGI